MMRVGGSRFAPASSSLSVLLPVTYPPLPYLHVAVELDFNGLCAVLREEVPAVVGHSQVDKGVVLKHGRFQVESLDRKL